jgi:glycosidase
MRALNAGKDFDSHRRAVTYIENHDHSTITEQCGGRSSWWRTQPLAIALMTISGAPLIHNGQEWGEQYWFPEDGPTRVRSRPLRWDALEDSIGRSLFALYKKLIAIRRAHPALQGQNFHPDPYDERATELDGDGYGVSETRDVAVFHRWGNDANGTLERFIIVLNFSSFDQTIDIPFSTNGEWRELLAETTTQVNGFRLLAQTIGSHWGRIYVHRAP